MADQSNQPDPVPSATQAPIPAPNETPTSDKPAKHSLTYALDSQQVKKRARRRKQFFIAGLLALIISGFWWAPATYRRINFQIALYQCKTHEFPPNTVVVETTLKNEKMGPQLRILQALGAPRWLGAPTTVYVHQRSSANSSHLVIVEAMSFSAGSVSNPIDLNIYLDGYGQSPATYGILPVTNKVANKIFAGQTDPNDPSHFTIAFIRDGKPGTLDGYLRNDRVILEVSPPEMAPRKYIHD